ncbi:27544_t:CDS:2, partial [Racocetra persica]
PSIPQYFSGWCNLFTEYFEDKPSDKCALGAINEYCHTPRALKDIAKGFLENQEASYSLQMK